MINLLDNEDINISTKKNIELDIDKYIDIAAKTKNIELEYIFGINQKKSKEIMNKDLFMRLLKYCKENYIDIERTYNLDIKLIDISKYGKYVQSNTRCTLKDKRSIIEYCKKDEINDDMNIEYIDKQNYKKDTKTYSLLNDEYNYRLNLKKEGYNEGSMLNFKENMKNKLKYFRYKCRSSFMTRDGLFRIDITAVKSNSYNLAKGNFNYYKTFKESNLLNMTEIYELEIEYIGNMKCNGILNISNFIENGEKLVNVLDDNGYKSAEFIDIGTTNILTELSIEEDIPVDMIDKRLLNKIKERFNIVIYDINSYIYDTKNIMKTSLKDKILIEYYELTNQKYKNIDGQIKDKKNMRLQLPQPVILNFENMDITKIGNIYKNYSVTEKADGYRYVLFITEDKKGYLINNKLEVKDIDIIFPTVDDLWLFDGEYINKDKNGNDINLYMIFDVYYANQESLDPPLHAFPFISSNRKKMSRYDVLNTFMTYYDDSISNSKDKIRINIKRYKRGNIRINKDQNSNNLILIESNKILKNKDSYEYRIDGLIFLPNSEPVSGKFDKNIPKKINGTWYYNYKWKPPEENTIDFKVIINKTKHDKKIKDEIIPLTVTDNDDKTITYTYKKLSLFVIYNIMKESQDIDYCMEILKKPKKRGEIIIFDPPNTKKNVSVTNIILKDGNILCEDKDIIKDGDIVEMRYNENAENNMIWEPLRIRRDKENPQNYAVANNIWSTIIDPITTDMISGDKNISDIKPQINKETLGNYYIATEKSIELEPLKQFHNYIKSKLIMGVCSISKNKKNIMDTSIGQGGDINKYLDKSVNCQFLFGLDQESVNEACKRFYQKNVNIKSVMLRYDTSKNIKNKSGMLDIDNTYTENMINILYDIKDSKINKEYEKINKKYNGLAKKKFDVISSQFTIHYYFKDEETLNGYLTNILENIKTGGYFIGTCYDGKYIYNSLNKPEPFEYINKKGKIVYSINKKYNIDNFDYKGTNENMLGQEIDVYMESIGQKITEYLVNFDYFIDIMDQYGFEPHLPNIKTKYSNVIDNSIGNFADTIKNLEKLKSDDPDLKEYYEKSIDILENKELLKLSSMNKYFIFRKK